MTNVAVRKSSAVVVKPSEPVTIGNTIRLSSLDTAWIGFPVTAFFVFDQPIQEPAEIIKKALSQALVHYYPISGRLAPGANDDVNLHIHCFGEGVPFVAASASFALKQAKFFDQSPGAKELLDELALYDDPGECGSLPNPLIMMQVTEFTCGGFVVGVTWDHSLADGHGMAQFMQAVGQIARGLSPPPAVPIRLDDSLMCLPPSVVALQKFLFSLEHKIDITCLDVTIPSSTINRIRAEYRFRSSGGQSSCTMFEVVAAMLWWCRTRATMSNPEAPSILSFAADVRKYVGAKDGYYGNCIAEQVVMATSATVANGDIIDAINLIKHAKDQIPHQFKRNGITACEQLQAVSAELIDSEARYGALVLTSWRNIGFEELDFGSGKTARVMCYWKLMALPVPLCVMCLPWKGMDGANVMSLCVKKEDADAFTSELSNFM